VSDATGRSGDDCCAAFQLQHDRAISRRPRKPLIKTGHRPQPFETAPEADRTDVITSFPKTSAVVQFDAQIEAICRCAVAGDDTIVTAWLMFNDHLERRSNAS
jgi:hypothetical protein